MKSKGILGLMLLGGLSLPLSAASVSSRSFNPVTYTPGVPVEVTIVVTPDPSVLAYALEETPPSGWTISNVDNSGSSLGGIIKWGVFFDATPRTFKYQVTPSLGTSGIKNFSGKVSYDGGSATIGGAASLQGEGAAAGPDSSEVRFKTVIHPLKGETINVPDNNAAISSVAVHDLKGNEIKSLDHSGNEFVWNGKNQSGKVVASGIYLLIIKDGGSSKIVKISVIK